tara:strand:- start:221 stop:328 length:108 start_codon:yes stop_codon:yes gene_type:complete
VHFCGAQFFAGAKAVIFLDAFLSAAFPQNGAVLMF